MRPTQSEAPRESCFWATGFPERGKHVRKLYPGVLHVVFRVGSVAQAPPVHGLVGFSSKGGISMRTIRYGMLALFALFLVMGLAGVGLADETQGKFKNALADKKSFVVTEQDNDHTFQLGANAKILINNRESTLTDLKAGDVVTVTWQERDGRKEASMIVCRRR